MVDQPFASRLHHFGSPQAARQLPRRGREQRQVHHQQDTDGPVEVRQHLRVTCEHGTNVIIISDSELSQKDKLVLTFFKHIIFARFETLPHLIRLTYSHRTIRDYVTQRRREKQ